MEDSIFIGATRHMDILHASLKQQLKPLSGKGIRVNLEKSPDGKFTFVACSISGRGSKTRSDNVRSLCRDNITVAICELILNHWEKVILENIIRDTYYYFSIEERGTILSHALEHISGRPGERDRQRGKRKEKILAELSDFLDANNYIIIDGFIRFRLKDYVNELYDIAEQAVDDFLMDREYREFIQLLKYFVDIQESRVEQVNVIMNPDGVFKLYDERGELIDNDQMEQFMVEFISSEINYEDLLISSLVTISPGEIILHFSPTGNQTVTVDTITKVFPGRVKYCQGCAMCEREKE